MIKGIVKSCAGMDVHKKNVVVTVLKENEKGEQLKETREYRTFRNDLREMSNWLAENDVEIVAMEATGIYWKTVYEVLEDKAITAIVVNAQHVKNVPGRKTDVQDSEWLAELLHCGLLKGSFIPPKDLRELRLLTRYRKKISGYLSGQKNRLQKILEDAGIRLSCVVSDINGKSAQKMIKALIDGEMTLEEIKELALGRLKKKKEEILLSLDGKLTDRHRFLLKKIQDHIQRLEKEIKEIDEQIVAAMQPYEKEWRLLQTIPGIDVIGASILLAEIGTDMKVFGNKSRLSSWAGMCPGNNESAGKKKAEKARKEINTYEVCYAK